MKNSINFYLNGKSVVIENPSPSLLLIDYLRSPEVGLTGAKKGCGQGGCGACTVILSRWNPDKNQVEHRSINSCLRPVCSLGGLSVTTIEGTGGVERTPTQNPKFAPSFAWGGANTSIIEPPEHWQEVQEKLLKFRKKKLEQAKKVLEEAQESKAFMMKNPLSNGNPNVPTPKDPHEGMNPVAHRLAINNGTQCGYCTTGFVMNMSAYLADNPSPTKKEIEGIFDGNICRCTGYRSIMTGMKTFAKDWTLEDEKKRMKCITDDRCKEIMVHNHISIPFADDAKNLSHTVTSESDTQLWLTPETLEELKSILKKHTKKSVRMVFGNTSFGIYPDAFNSADVLVDIKLIKEMKGIHQSDEMIEIGGLTTYTEFIDSLSEARAANKLPENSRWGAVDFMARRTAGMIVRNAGSIAGNSMLVLKHIFENDPFPSDIFTAFAATETEIEYLDVSSDKIHRHRIETICDKILKHPDYSEKIVILRYFIPKSKKHEVTLAQKVALRQVNSHSIVNVTTRFNMDKTLKVDDLSLVFGGIAPYPWHPKKTEAWMKGKTLSLDMFPKVLKILNEEIDAELKKWAKRMEQVPNEGFTSEYKKDLASTFLYKAVINALNDQNPDSVPAYIAASGKITWGHWPVTDGTQDYSKKKEWRSPVSLPIVKLMAFQQAMGEVHYTHEIELPPLGKNAAFIQSNRALANYYYVIPGKDGQAAADEVRLFLAEKFEGFYELITHKEIPEGGINLQGMGADQPLLAVDQVSYVGQVISMVIADTEQEAIEIAEYASEYCVGYSEVNYGPEWDKKWNDPILSIDQAIEMQSFFPDSPKSASHASHIWKITRPGSDFQWMTNFKPWEKKPLTQFTSISGNKVAVIKNTQVSGCQVHFYMETQSCVAYPEDDHRIILHPSSQSPTAMHQTSAMAIGSEHNKVEVAIRQLGGGYGGKTEQTRFIAGPTAIAAAVLNLPVRLVMKREHDTAMIGKRHAYYSQYQIAVDTGETNKDDKGIIRGINLKLWGDGGAFYDCSFVVANCIQLRTDNAYNIKNFESQLDVCRTNTAPNTAMRAFGDIQGKLMLENAIDDGAYSIDMDPYEFRLKNMYRQGDVTPFGQALSYCYMRDVWNYCKEKSEYESKMAQVDKFNRENKWIKRGVYMVPVKYGSGYNLTMIEQATAMVSIYSGDGSIIINQGGVDMGQGITTQIEQVASYILNVPMEMIQVLSARTSVIPNPTSTGGSTGTAYNGEAVKQTCEIMRARLYEFGQQLLKENGEQWCIDQGVDFWNYGTEGWSAMVTKKGEKNESMIWQNLVALASQKRIKLVATFNALVRGGTVPVPVMTFKPKNEQPQVPGIPLADGPVKPGEVDSFNGFTFSAACAMVEVDILTGETKILEADLVYDMGWSLNPALDIGQVEGAFIQGVGYVLTEKLVMEETGKDKGRLNTLNTWRYKPPAITTIPLNLNTYLYPRDQSQNIPENPNGLLSSKEVGEPPLVLASSVFFAVKAAIRASRVERDLDPLFRFDAPATVQEVRRASEVRDRDLTS
jgi:xanthine dehydrogenase/oxidase